MQLKQGWLRCGLLIAMLGWSVGIQPAAAQYTRLYSFSGYDGAIPYGSPTVAGSTLYGMTCNGGPGAGGVIFQINTNGTGFIDLYSFSSVPGYPSYPQGDLTLAGTNLYGMTVGGGAAGCGVIFQINTDGTGYTNLHQFAEVAGNGAIPIGSLTLSGSTFYGMTSGGGAAYKGVIFQINTGGTGYTNLHEFAGGAGDGAIPKGSLMLSGSTLYGMTSQGGAVGYGVIFQINTNGTGYTNLYEFTGFAGGGICPNGSLTLSGSTLYGMTQSGGAPGNGVIFQINTNGTGYTNLHEFVGGAGDGAIPNGSLTLSGSSLYGMTVGGGAKGGGVIFQINTDGTGYTNLYEFAGAPGDGANPYYGSLALSGITLYGMTSEGGAQNDGTVFALETKATMNVLANPVNGGSASGSGAYVFGANIQIQATASNGWVFTGWNDGVMDNPRSITVASDMTITANFSLLPVRNIQGMFPVATNASEVNFCGGIASCGTNYLVALVSDSNVVVKIVQTNGATTANGLKVGDTGALGVMSGGAPSVAYGASKYLVAWTDGSITNGGTNTFGQFVSPAGALAGSAFGFTNEASELLGLASDGTNYIAVLVDSNSNLRSQLIAANGTFPVASAQLADDSADAQSATIVFGKTNYFVAWQSHLGSDSNATYGSFISPGGVVRTPFQISEMVSADQNSLAGAFDGTNYLVAWNYNLPGMGHEIHGRLVAPDGTFRGHEMTMLAAANSSDMPALAFGASCYLMLWVDESSAPTFNFQFYDRSLNVVASGGSTNSGAMWDVNSVLFDGTQFVAAPTFGAYTTNADGSWAAITAGSVWSWFIAPLWITNATVTAEAYPAIGGSVTGGGTYAMGANIQLVATASNHWHFTRWTGQTNGCTISGNKITVPVTGRRVITAGFALNQITLKVNSQWGSPSPAAGLHTNDYGATIENAVLWTDTDALGATQVTCRGWTMTGNAPVSDSMNSFTMTQTNNAVLSWLWRTNFLLATYPSGSGTVSVATGWYGGGTNITIRATPFWYSHFFGWAGDTTGATINGTNITVKMTSAKTITAQFGAYLGVQAAGLDNSTQKINIAVTPNDYSNKAAGTTPFTRCYAENSVVQLSAPATLAGGWNFAWWSGVNSQSGTNATVTVKSNTIVRALYDPASVVVITNPTAGAAYTTTNRILNIRGIASNSVSGIDHVIYSNNRGGSDLCTGTETWLYNGITLYNGTNIITVTAYDGYGNTASDTLKVTYSSKYSKLQNLVLLGGAVVRQINMADDLTPGTTNAIQWQVEAFEPVLSGVKIRLPLGGSITNVTLNGVLMGTGSGSTTIGEWQSKVYSFQTDWITPSIPGACRIRFLTARKDGYAYVNANIPDGIDSDVYGPDGKEISRSIAGGGTTPAIQNEALTKASPAFEKIAQAEYRAGGVVQKIQITNNLTPGSVATCRWSILTYPSVQARMSVDLPGGSNFVGTGTKKATSNTWWRLPKSGTLVEYSGSVSNDSLAKVGTYYSLKEYYYQYVWTVPNDTGTCSIAFEVAPNGLTNWVGAVLPENVDGTNVTDGVTIERQIAP